VEPYRDPAVTTSRQKFTRTMYLWIDNIVEGFIIEFAVDTVKSYSAAEKEFLKGPIGRYIR
jgi:hypothetical protein